MNAPSLAIGWWLDQLEEAGREVAAASLGATNIELRERAQGLPTSIAGSCVALVGDECAAQIGICSDVAGSHRIAAMMLGMEEGEELDEEGVTDAICELANILAGVVKTRVAKTIPGFRLGLPVFFRGSLSVPAASEAASLSLWIDGVPVELLVLRSGSG